MWWDLEDTSSSNSTDDVCSYTETSVQSIQCRVLHGCRMWIYKHCWFQQWRNFENQSTFAEAMGKNQVSCFWLNGYFLYTFYTSDTHKYSISMTKYAAERQHWGKSNKLTKSTQMTPFNTILYPGWPLSRQVQNRTLHRRFRSLLHKWWLAFMDKGAVTSRLLFTIVVITSFTAYLKNQNVLVYISKHWHSPRNEVKNSLSNS